VTLLRFFIYPFFRADMMIEGIITPVHSGVDNNKSFYFGRLQVYGLFSRTKL